MDSEIWHSGPKTWIPLVTFPGHLFKLALEKVMDYIRKHQMVSW